MHILPNGAQANSRQKVMEIIFPMRRELCWHKGKGGWVSSTTMATDWPSKSLKLSTRCGADDVLRPDRLTWLVMPTTRLAPMGLSEAEMCVGHSKECTNLLFIKCGVTWDWRLNGDLSVIQPLHRHSHMALWLVSFSIWALLNVWNTMSSVCTVKVANQEPSLWQWAA